MNHEIVCNLAVSHGKFNDVKSMSDYVSKLTYEKLVSLIASDADTLSMSVIRHITGEYISHYTKDVIIDDTGLIMNISNPALVIDYIHSEDTPPCFTNNTDVDMARKLQAANVHLRDTVLPSGPLVEKLHYVFKRLISSCASFRNSGHGGTSCEHVVFINVTGIGSAAISDITEPLRNFLSKVYIFTNAVAPEYEHNDQHVLLRKIGLLNVSLPSYLTQAYISGSADEIKLTHIEQAD